MAAQGYVCHICGKFHKGPPLSYSTVAPAQSTTLPVYPSTLSLKTHVHTRPVGVRPFVELEPTDHPLAVELRTGIAMQRVREIAGVLLHSAEN